MAGVVVGGLGGGGDVGLASIIVEALGLGDRVAAVASFHRCWAGGSRGVGARVRGALVRITGGVDLGRRVFEDKLQGIAGWAGEVYLVCLMEPWRSIAEAMEWLATRLEPDCILAADIGGDGLLLGYEKRLGTYIEDAVARAALAWASEQYGVESIVAVGGIGAEGGGGELLLPDLYATVKYLEQKGIVLGGLAPGPRHTRVARRLLEMAESGMLPLYLAAVEGRRKTIIHRAYLRGEYVVKPWYRYVLFLDAENLCRHAPLCAAARRGEAALRKWRPPRPPHDYAKLYKEALRAAEEGRLEHLFTTLIERLARRHRLPCTG